MRLFWLCCSEDNVIVEVYHVQRFTEIYEIALSVLLSCEALSYMAYEQLYT